MRNKRITILLLFVVLLLALTSCGKDEPLGLDKTVAEILSEEGVSHCVISSIGDYSALKLKIDIPVISEEEYQSNFVSETEHYGELSEERVREEFGYDTIEQYKAEIDRRYLEHRKVEIILRARNEIIDSLLGDAKFELDEDEVANYSKRMVYKEENLSILFGYDSFEDYLRYELEVTKEQFLRNCYAEAEDEIKRSLLVGAIAKKEGIEVPQDEDIFLTYQDLENAVYGLFMDVEEGF